MDTTKGQYYFATLYSFDGAARQDVISRARKELSLETCTYDDNEAVFSVSCQTAIGATVDESFHELLDKHIERELRQAEKEERLPMIKRYTESKLDPFDAGDEDEERSDNTPSGPAWTTITATVVNAEGVKTDVGILKLQDLPDIIRQRLLVPTSFRGWCTIRAVQRVQHDPTDLQFAARTGAAAGTDEESASLVLPPIKLIGNVAVPEHVQAEEELVQEWEYVGQKPSVKQWVEGVGETRLVDPNERSKVPSETLRMLAASTAQPSAGRLRIPQGTSVLHLSEDGFDREPDRDSDSSSSSEDDSGEPNKPDFHGLFHAVPTEPVLPAQMSPKPAFSGPFTNTTNQVQPASTIQPKPLFGDLLSGRVGGKEPSPRTSPKPRPDATQEADYLQTPRLTPNSAASNQAKPSYSSLFNAETEPLHSPDRSPSGEPYVAPSVDQTRSLQHAASIADSSWHNYGHYTNVDNFGLTGHPSKQADWEHTTNFQGSWTPSMASQDTAVSTVRRHWDTLVNRSQCVPTGRLIDDSSVEPVTTTAASQHLIASPARDQQDSRNVERTPPPAMGNLVGVSENESPIEERLQTPSAHSKRALHRTMQQKAQKKGGKKGSNRGSPSKTTPQQQRAQLELPAPLPIPSAKGKLANSEITSTAPASTDYRDKQLDEQLLRVLEAGSFPIKVTVHFGIAMVQTRELQNQAWSAQSVQKKLFALTPDAQFCRRLTTSTSDAAFLLALSSEQPARPSVVYEFQISDVNRVPHALTVDQDNLGDYQLVKLDQPYGCLHLHNATRMHDLNLEVSPAAPSAPPSVSQDAIDDFITDLTSSADATELLMQVPPAWSVDRVLVKRIFLTRTLVLTQCQDLILEHAGATTKATRLGDEDDMIAKHRLWWEMKLLSEDASGIGDVHVAADVCRALLKQAQSFVAAMDGVGAANLGPLTDLRRFSPVKKGKEREEALAPPPFW